MKVEVFSKRLPSIYFRKNIYKYIIEG